MKIAILTANLGSFDTPVDPVKQDYPQGIDEVKFHRFTDENFPPITGMTPRMQYRLCKLFGHEFVPGYDIYIWLDGSVSLQRPDCLQWFLEQLGEKDAAFFKHPQRGTIKAEAIHIEEKLNQKHWYITPRYANGLHMEMVHAAYDDKFFNDDTLYASTVFIYRNNKNSQNLMKEWWYYQSRYYTCDQVALPYAIHQSRARVKKVEEDLYKIPYLTLVSHHK